jgi:hypothetical protein
MKAILIHDFRVAQLAIKGAVTNAQFLELDGVDTISFGDVGEITEISLEQDVVTISVEDINNIVNIRCLAEHIVEDVISTMKAKAVELADKEVIVDINGNEVR